MYTTKLPCLLIFILSIFILGSGLKAQDSKCEKQCEKDLEWLYERAQDAKSNFTSNPTEYNEYLFDHQVFTYRAYVFLCMVRCEENVLIDPNFCVRTYWDFYRDHVQKYEETVYEASMLALLEWLKDALGCQVP